MRQTGETRKGKSGKEAEKRKRNNICNHKCGHFPQLCQKIISGKKKSDFISVEFHPYFIHACHLKMYYRCPKSQC